MYSRRRTTTVVEQKSQTRQAAIQTKDAVLSRQTAGRQQRDEEIIETERGA
jgi:hypothetical protein